jgi:Tfp pilus assembly protein PilF
MTRPRGWCFVIALALLSSWLPAKEESSVAFDAGEKSDLDKNYVYKQGKDTKNKDREKANAKTLKAVQYHLKNLKDSDPAVRQSSAEFLGILGSPVAVPDLINVLRPDQNERILVLLAANGALARITGKNFGYKNYEGWMQWWAQNKEEFLKKAETGPDSTAKIRAEAANTVGRELMRRGELRAAQAQFLDAVNSDPTVPDYRNNLGLSLMNQGRYLDAMENFQETMGLAPELPQPPMNIGHCYARMGKTIEAQTWYKKAMALDKEGKLWEPLWLLGKEYKNRGEFSLAFEYLDQARIRAEKLRLDNELHANLCKDLAITHYGLDQYYSAWKEIKNVETLGFKCDPGFVAKVRKALVDQGVDPEAEDKKAREVMRGENEEETRK